MTNTGKTIALVGGGVLLVGVAVVLATKKGGDTTTTTTTTPGVNDTSTINNQPAQAGIFWGNLASTLWSGLRNNQNTNATSADGTCNGIVVPADPYVGDGVSSGNYNSTQITSMQTYLSSLHNDIATVIANTGGADGIIGSGFREAYNMARKGCYISGIADLTNKAGA